MADFADILGHLVEHRVEFVVVGGYAAIAHGSTMMTQDVDICLHFSVGNLMRLQAALEALHPVHRMTPKRIPLRLTANTCAGLQNLCLDTDLGQLNCLSSIKGVGDYPVVFAQSIEVPLALGSCRILSLDALIEAKSPYQNERCTEHERFFIWQGGRSRPSEDGRWSPTPSRGKTSHANADSF